MINLILTPANSSPEITFAEYSPYFNYIFSTTYTPTFIATKYSELFYYKEKTIELNTLKATRRHISSITDCAIKDINVINFPKSKIAPHLKIYKKVFDITNEENIYIPKKSKLLPYLDKLKKASKIITFQEIFTLFAYIHNIPCLAFAEDWNANLYKNISNIKIVTTKINQEKIINNFLNC